MKNCVGNTHDIPFILDMTSRSRCFFDIKIDGNDGKNYLKIFLILIKFFVSFLVGRIVFELFNDICPRTCENFRCLCTGNQNSISKI